MLHIEDIQITHFIAHIIDHETARFELSEEKTPIGPGSDFPHDFFKHYILHAARHKNRRLARFQNSGVGKIKAAFAAARNGENAFVKASQEIATHLYNVMAGSRYKDLIKPGDVMVALFQDLAEMKRADESKTVAPTYMAILKINPSDAILRHIDPSNPKRRVIFERDERVPAPTEDEIQKIALISDRPQLAPEPHDIVVLDYNLREKNIAHFFYQDFLESELNRDAAETTRFILKSVKDILSKKAEVVDPPLVPNERIQILEQTEETLGKSTTFSLEQLSKVVELPDRPLNDREKLFETIEDWFVDFRQPEKRIGPQESVTISPARAVEESSTRTYMLDKGVRITGSTAALHDLLEISNTVDPEGKITITIKTKIFEIR